jgi:hypothetical protein
MGEVVENLELGGSVRRKLTLRDSNESVVGGDEKQTNDMMVTIGNNHLTSRFATFAQANIVR